MPISAGKAMDRFCFVQLKFLGDSSSSIWRLDEESFDGKTERSEERSKSLLLDGLVASDFPFQRNDGDISCLGTKPTHVFANIKDQNHVLHPFLRLENATMDFG